MDLNQNDTMGVKLAQSSTSTLIPASAFTASESGLAVQEIVATENSQNANGFDSEADDEELLAQRK
jgi:hypothetical protein